ncbi:hypothetical protein F2Q69_00053767 [Brassica cretica]|uniref:Uncharacterized protein n=1 Tax=Brassica cretica TaxID=69181 RepID=A0A8S9MUE4_BRACR|nr:hypothetical protein F2Q69_00053767 [Brassica cretica]
MPKTQQERSRGQLRLATASFRMVRFRPAICLPPSGVSYNIISWVCWTIWKDRNSLIFEGKGDLPENLATKSIALAREWSEAQVSTAKSQKTYSPPQNDRLNELPHPNIAVCMSDAAWEATRFRAGLAWVIKGELTSEVRRGSSHELVVAAEPEHMCGYWMNIGGHFNKLGAEDGDGGA